MTTRPPKGSDVQKALGETFRAIRTESGISLKALARRMQRSINTIRWHEAGSRSLRADDIVLAAQVMGRRPAELVEEQPEPEPEPTPGTEKTPEDRDADTAPA